MVIVIAMVGVAVVCLVTCGTSNPGGIGLIFDDAVAVAATIGTAVLLGRGPVPVIIFRLGVALVPAVSTLVRLASTGIESAFPALPVFAAFAGCVT